MYEYLHIENHDTVWLLTEFIQRCPGPSSQLFRYMYFEKVLVYNFFIFHMFQE